MMNTESRLGAEIVYQKELRYADDGHLIRQLTKVLPPEGVLIPLEKMVDILLPHGFCEMMCMLYGAGMDFIDIQISIDAAIRRKYREIDSKEVQA